MSDASQLTLSSSPGYTDFYQTSRTNPRPIEVTHSHSTNSNMNYPLSNWSKVPTIPEEIMHDETFYSPMTNLGIDQKLSMHSSSSSKWIPPSHLYGKNHDFRVISCRNKS